MTTTPDQPGRLGRRAAAAPPRRLPLPASSGQALVWLAVGGERGWRGGGGGGSVPVPVWNVSSIPGMSVLGAAVALPIAYLTCRSALAGTDSALEDAARGAGATPGQVIRRITLPMLRPAILNSTVLKFALSVGGRGIPLFLGTPPNIDFYASYLYKSWNSGATPDPPSVAAGAALRLIAVSRLLLIRARLAGSEQRFAATGPRACATR